MLKIVGNIIWLLLELALLYAFAGIVMFILIITIPWGIGPSDSRLTPFGHSAEGRFGLPPPGPFSGT